MRLACLHGVSVAHAQLSVLCRSATRIRNLSRVQEMQVPRRTYTGATIFSSHCWPLLAKRDGHFYSCLMHPCFLPSSSCFWLPDMLADVSQLYGTSSHFSQVLARPRHKPADSIS